VNLIDSQQETPFLQNINILSFSNFSDVNLIDSYQKNTLLQKRAVFIVRNFSTPNHGLELKSTLKTKTLVLVFKQFFGYPPPRRGHPRNTLLQKRAVFIVRNFLDAFPKGGGSLLPNNFVFGQHKNI